MQRFLDPAVLAGISSLDLLAKTVVDGFVAGLHRSPDFGIHHLLTQDFAIQPFLRDGYRVVATAKENVAALVSADETIADAPAPAAQPQSAQPVAAQQEA